MAKGEKKMKENQIKQLVRDCVKEYYAEDKKILIDISILQCTCITYFLYNQIFFGNKVLLFEETLNKVKKISKENTIDTKSEIRIKNAGYLLQAIERDERANYQIIKSKGESKFQSVCTFLQENEDGVYALSDSMLYQDLREAGFVRNLKFVQMGKREINPFQSRQFKFETIGAIQFVNEEMRIKQKGSTKIKVYNKRGFEKNEVEYKVEVGDYVLLIGEKDTCLSFNLYQIVSKHTRNHAMRIIWTDLQKGQNTNKYIGRLPYMFRKMILENAENN